MGKRGGPDARSSGRFGREGAQAAPCPAGTLSRSRVTGRLSRARSPGWGRGPARATGPWWKWGADIPGAEPQGLGGLGQAQKRPLGMSLPRVPGCGGPPAPRLRPSDSVERPGSLYARPILDGARVPADRKGGAPEAICKGLPATTSTPAIRPAPHTARPHPSPSRTLHPSPVLGPASGPDTATGSSWGFPGVLRFCGAWKCAQHWDCGPWERHLLLGYQGPPSECVPSSPTPPGTPVAVGGGSHPPACSPSFQPHPAHSGLCKHPPPPPPLPLDPGGGRRGGGGSGWGDQLQLCSVSAPPGPA